MGLDLSSPKQYNSNVLRRRLREPEGRLFVSNHDIRPGPRTRREAMKEGKVGMRTYGIAGRRGLPACLVSAVLLLVVAPAPGVITHPLNPLDPSGPDNAPTLTPDDAIIGRWKYSASCVVIGMPGWTATNYVLTTAHQSGGVGDIVRIDGVAYTIAWAEEHSTADVRIAQLEDAYVPFYGTMYDGTGEIGMEIVMAGHGRTRGDEKKTGGQTYAYAWGGTLYNTNGVNWASNEVDSIGSEQWEPGMWSTYIQADFDALYEPDATAYEGVIADHDSGGGWFHNAGTEEDPEWELIGLSTSTEGKVYEHAKFRNRDNPSQPDPDWMRATRVSSYASWIESWLIDPAYDAGDANFNDTVDQDDLDILLANFGMASGAVWRDGDFNFDGSIDDEDLSLLLTNFDYATGAPSLPEPATAALLACGWLLLGRRRRR
jgi:hypothetical protein